MTCTYVVYSRHESIKGVCYEDTPPRAFLRGHRNINALRYALAAAITCVCACCMLFPHISDAASTKPLYEQWYSSSVDDYENPAELKPKKNPDSTNVISPGISRWHLVPNDSKTEYTLEIKAPESYEKPSGKNVKQTFYDNLGYDVDYYAARMPWQMIFQLTNNKPQYPITKVSFIKNENGNYNIVWLNVRLNTNSRNYLVRLFEGFKTVKEFDMSGLAVLSNKHENYETWSAAAMFQDCEALEDLKDITWPKQNKDGVTGDAYINSPSEDKLETFNWRGVNTIWQMFCNCINLKRADLSFFKKIYLTGYATRGLFYNCKWLDTITIPENFYFPLSPSICSAIGPIMYKDGIKRRGYALTHDFWQSDELDPREKGTDVLYNSTELENLYSNTTTKPKGKMTWRVKNYTQIGLSAPADGTFSDTNAYKPNDAYSIKVSVEPKQQYWWIPYDTKFIAEPKEIVYQDPHTATEGWYLYNLSNDSMSKWDFSKPIQKQYYDKNHEKDRYIRLIAKTKKVWNVTFDANGGKLDDNEEVKVKVDQGGKLTEPKTPTKSGANFDGWYNGDAKWDFSTVVTDDMTLKAHWTKAETQSTSGNELVMMYRLYNPYSHEHLFTIDSLEKDKLASIGWSFEGSVGKVGTHGEKGGVYRLYNKTSGEHHYTMDEDEVAHCVKAGWINEGVKFFSVDEGELAMYSMYNPYEKEFYHHYTSDAGEMAKMVHDGWRKETIKWKAAK